MAGMPRMTLSAPRKLLREFVWLCHRRDKSASCVLREFMAEFVDSRWAELDARDAEGMAPRIAGMEPETESALADSGCNGAAARGPRGGGP
jgi:hypothetical protein